MSFLDVSGISVVEEGNVILHDITFSLKEHQKIAIAGETGSGKSTLLQTIAGLVQPASGQVLYQGKKVIGPHDKLVPGHADIAYLSQHFELPQFLRVEQVLSYTNTLSGEEANTLYEICRISHLAKRKTNQLSGGERQRIALARLLSSWPGLLLLDEPFSNLDMGHKSILKAVINDISEELGITCLLISHDPHDTLSWADEIMVMQNGKLIQQGRPQQIYQQPVNEYAASLFGKYNVIPPGKAGIFTQLTSKETTSKSLLIRPERFIVTRQDSSAITGKVTTTHYFGSHYELEILVEEVPLTIRTGENNYKPGDSIGISVPDNAVWFV
ncbi:ABC transporter ATP-binding protein [Pontibacter fetidus]|uniref:ABC transporter ATP-binding protein n=1 Tax=Pontibacter fetidus TaxID=2700082 RepID=A0A6B2H4T5_9BACT|nr:ABC transporter ATP-binding protein [Pontibacter fetidus]NDK57423.1 ABC transporter ATP-binding protein [Pontibacter fetidus]